MITVFLGIHWVLFLSLAALQVRFFKVNAFHPASWYLLFHFIVFVLRPTAVYSLEWYRVFEYQHYMPNPQVAVETLALTDFALIVFLSVCWSLNWKLRELSPFREDGASGLLPLSQAQITAFKIVAGALLIPVLWSLYYGYTHPIVHGHNGSLNAIELTQDLKTGATKFQNSTAYLFDLQYVGGALALMWAYVNRFRFISLLPLVGYTFLRAAQGGGRFSFALLAIAVGLAFLAQRRLSKPTLRMMLGAALVGALFMSVGTDRLLIRRALGQVSDVELATTSQDENREWSDNSSLNGPDFANYEFLSYVVNVVPEQSHTYTYFTQYLTLLIKPIPRMIWPDKPDRDLITMINLNDYGNFFGLTVSLVGDGWMSLGLPGVAITMAIAAAICAGVYGRLFRGPVSPFRLIGTCIFLALSPQWFRDGGYSVVEFLCAHLAPVALWWLVWRIMIAAPKTRPAMATARVAINGTRR